MTSAKKLAYRARLESYLEEFPSLLVIGIDNVGSNQLQKSRIALRGRAQILMGKNTMMRKILRDNAVDKPELEDLIPFIVGNIGLVFCKSEDMKEIRTMLTAQKVPAAAKGNSIAPSDVFVDAGPSGLDPGQTAFFQALNIQTKIVRGAIEIVNRVHLIKEGEKITSSAVALLSKLKILPFFYGIKVMQCYEEGSCYSEAVLDLTPAMLQQKFMAAASQVAALGLQIGYPCLATVPHQLANGFQTLVAISIETDYVFEQAKIFKEMAENPDAFAAAAPAAAAGGGGGAAPAPAPEPEPESESEDGDGFDLFD